MTSKSNKSPHEEDSRKQEVIALSQNTVLRMTSEMFSHFGSKQTRCNMNISCIWTAPPIISPNWALSCCRCVNMQRGLLRRGARSEEFSVSVKRWNQTTPVWVCTCRRDAWNSCERTNKRVWRSRFLPAQAWPCVHASAFTCTRDGLKVICQQAEGFSQQMWVLTH